MSLILTLFQYFFFFYRSLHCRPRNRTTGSLRSHAIIVRNNRSYISAWTQRLISMANDQHTGGERRSNGQSTAIAHILGAFANFLAQIRHRTNTFDVTNYNRNRILSLLDSAVVERLPSLVVHIEYAEELASTFAVLSTNGLRAGCRLDGIGREPHRWH